MRIAGGHAAVLALSAALSGCAAVGPNYFRPAAAVPAQYKEIKGWKSASPRDDFVKGEWWKVFNDAELNRLEAMVSISNQTLKADAANYRQARDLIDQARAQLLPGLNFNPSFTRSHTNGGYGDNLTAEASASWTLDLWGKIRRTVESDAAAAQVSEAQLANARLAAQSALALAYVQLRQADSLQALLEQTIADYRRSQAIANNQYTAGTTSKADFITAQAQLLSAQAQQINAGVARAQNEHAIAVLTGRPPAALSVGHSALAQNIPAIPVQVPSSLLERRPDIAAAERTMAERNASIGVAIAAYYPDITLSGAFGYSGNPFIKPLAGANPVWNIGIAAAQTLFNGGATAAQVAGARDAYESSVASYKQTVLTAFQQVEDQLATLRILAKEAAIQAQASAAARQAVQIAINEYQAGTQTYTTVVTAQATLLSDEESALTTRGQRMTAAVNLIVALGGGWNEANLAPLAKWGPPPLF